MREPIEQIVHDVRTMAHGGDSVIRLRFGDAMRAAIAERLARGDFEAALTRELADVLEAIAAFGGVRVRFVALSQFQRPSGRVLRIPADHDFAFQADRANRISPRPPSS